MSEWIVIPSLLALRNEFNLLAPNRDKGADGTIGDTSHSSSSDHTPDEDSDVLRSRDADKINEVHALDIDSSGPWPGASNLTQFQRFDAIVKKIIAQERKRWLDANDKCRTRYIIWNKRIYSQGNDFLGETYTGTSDPHINHAHISGRYETVCEQDISPWGVYKEEDMTKSEFMAWLDEYFASANGRLRVANAVVRTDNVVNINDPNGEPDAGFQSLVRWGDVRATEARDRAAEAKSAATEAKTNALEAKNTAQAAKDAIDNVSLKVDTVLQRMPQA